MSHEVSDINAMVSMQWCWCVVIMVSQKDENLCLVVCTLLIGWWCFYRSIGCTFIKMLETCIVQVLLVGGTCQMSPPKRTRVCRFVVCLISFVECFFSFFQGIHAQYECNGFVWECGVCVDILVGWVEWGGRNYLVFTSLIRNQVENPLTEICMCLLKYRQARSLFFLSLFEFSSSNPKTFITFLWKGLSS